MQTGNGQVYKSCELTAQDMHDAYVACELRQIGIGMARVLETPSLYTALCNTAIARKKKKQLQDGKPAPIQQALV